MVPRGDDGTSRSNPAVFDPTKKPEENVAAALFRLCEAVEQGNAKLAVVASEIQTLRHAVISLGDKKK
jgi:hypothetical protein